MLRPLCSGCCWLFLVFRGCGVWSERHGASLILYQIRGHAVCPAPEKSPACPKWERMLLRSFSSLVNWIKMVLEVFHGVILNLELHSLRWVSSRYSQGPEGLLMLPLLWTRPVCAWIIVTASLAFTTPTLSKFHIAVGIDLCSHTRPCT